ncbi:hypothetical protein IFM89_033857 [Coptis chinensis]|uniref:Sugar phosphate transporter domain-containing protein n=1 Tax=Coptis chinensis TaxID=261450 RepID=A0A835LW92_9MAGN|nr:hypothetical protein IFM89_033857 [Coptis chinensis]
MSTTAVLFSPSPFLKPRRLNNNTFRFSPIRFCTPRPLDLTNDKPRSSSFPCLSLSSRFNSWTWVPSDREIKKEDCFKLKAGDGNVEESTSSSSSLTKTLQLGSFFGLWYIFNIYFNIYNKQVLKVFPFPVTITSLQFAVGTVVVFFMWALNLHKKPQITTSQLVAILPLAVVHTMGNLFTNMSLGKVAVSFTHTIKAMEPFFSVLFSAMFLGEQSMDNINLFSIITVMSLFLLFPVALFTEGVKFTPSYLQSAGLNVKDLGTKALLAGLCFHAYQQVSYMILQRVSPVTHSVGNCVKRVVVIVTSVLFFRTPVTSINSLGTGIALAGVFLYSRVKSLKPKPKAA